MQYSEKQSELKIDNFNDTFSGLEARVWQTQDSGEGFFLWSRGSRIQDREGTCGSNKLLWMG